MFFIFLFLRIVSLFNIHRLVVLKIICATDTLITVQLFQVMPPQYFERSAANSVVGSPLTPRRLNEVRAETGGLGKGELFFKHSVFITLTPCPVFTNLNGVQKEAALVVYVQLCMN